MKQTLLATFAIFFSLISLAQDKKPTLEQVWSSYMFYPQTSYKTKPLPNSEQYLKVYKNKIYSTDYKNGEDSKLIVDLNNYSDFKLNKRNYWFNNQANKVLTANDVEPIYRHSFSGKYSIFDLSTQKTQTIANDSVIQSVHFSPDGERVAYVFENNLFIQENDSIIQVTSDGKRNHVINGLADWVYEEEFAIEEAYKWSPDSRYILYLKTNESKVKQMQIPVYNGEYPEMYTFKYPKTGEENSDIEAWVYDTKLCKNILLANAKQKGYEYIPRIEWTSDEKSCAVWFTNRQQNKLDIHKINVEDLSSSTIYSEQTDTYLELSDQMYFTGSDGWFIMLTNSEAYRYLNLYNDRGQKVSRLSPDNKDVTEIFGYDEATKTIYFQVATSPLERHVYKYSLKTNLLSPVVTKKGTNSIEIVAEGKYLIHKHSSANSLPQFVLLDNKGKKIRDLQLNDRNQAFNMNYSLPEKSFFKFQNKSGDSLNGWMILPPKFKKNKKHPVLFTIYGGPGYQTVQDKWTYDYYWHAVLANEGYIIVSVDCRGSGARGSEFQKQTYKQLGVKEAEDFIAAAEYMATKKFVDPARIGIQGWSYGGYMSLLALCMSDNVFKAGIAIAPVSDWKFYDSIYTERFMDTPENNEEGYKNSSVLTYINGMNENLLLIHGSFDDNVHVQHSHSVAKELVKKNIPFEYMIYPDKNHSIYGDNARFHLFNKVFDFIYDSL